MSDTSSPETETTDSDLLSVTETDTSLEDEEDTGKDTEEEQEEEQEEEETTEEQKQDDSPTDDYRELKGRQLKAEDAEWAVCPVEYLVDVCLKFIANHFIEIGVKQVEKRVDKRQWQQIMDILPLDVPEEQLFHTLDDESYWKRRGSSLWEIWDILGGDWKKRYAEHRVAETIESFIPNVSDPMILDKVVKMSRMLVTSLHIRQLQLSNVTKLSPEDEEEEDVLPRPYAPLCHMDVGRVLLRFPKLEDISLTVAPTNCGLNYEYEHFELSLKDTQMLVESLRKMPKLRSFRVYGSYTSQFLVQSLTETFVNHASLKILDLSYNLLDFKTCKPIYKFLMASSTLEELVLCYNAIGSKGAAYIGAALTENTKLKALDLRMNGIDDFGGEFFALCIQRNNKLENLNISGNKLGEKSGYAFGDLIEMSKSMKYLNLSSNSIGKEAGRRLHEAMEQNTTLEELDIRLCDIGEEAEIAIRERTFNNANADLILPAEY